MKVIFKTFVMAVALWVLPRGYSAEPTTCWVELMSPALARGSGSGFVAIPTLDSLPEDKVRSLYDSLTKPARVILHPGWQYNFRLQIIQDDRHVGVVSQESVQFLYDFIDQVTESLRKSLSADESVNVHWAELRLSPAVGARNGADQWHHFEDYFAVVVPLLGANTEYFLKNRTFEGMSLETAVRSGEVSSASAVTPAEHALVMSGLQRNRLWPSVAPTGHRMPQDPGDRFELVIFYRSPYSRTQ
jgi:hypothetical protein